MAKSTVKKVKKVIKPETRELTQEDLDANPELAEQGLAVGDEVEIDEKEEAEAGEEDKTDGSEPEEDESDEDEEESEEAVDILNGERYIRQYSKKIHGKKYLDLAKQFVSNKRPKIGEYTMVPANEITKVEVRYREKEDAELHLDKQKPDAPMVSKVKQFTDKNAAVEFGAKKRQSTVVVSKDGRKKK